MKRIVLVLVAILFLTCCSSTDWNAIYQECTENSKIWIDQTEHDLIMRFGNSPYPIESDGAGGKIIKYMKYGEIDRDGLKTIMYRQYFINQKGIIYHTRCYIV